MVIYVTGCLRVQDNECELTRDFRALLSVSVGKKSADDQIFQRGFYFDAIQFTKLGFRQYLLLDKDTCPFHTAIGRQLVEVKHTVK